MIPGHARSGAKPRWASDYDVMARSEVRPSRRHLGRVDGSGDGDACGDDDTIDRAPSPAYLRGHGAVDRRGCSSSSPDAAEVGPTTPVDPGRPDRGAPRMPSRCAGAAPQRRRLRRRLERHEQTATIASIFDLVGRQPAPLRAAGRRGRPARSASGSLGRRAHGRRVRGRSTAQLRQLRRLRLTASGPATRGSGRAHRGRSAARGSRRRGTSTAPSEAEVLGRPLHVEQAPATPSAGAARPGATSATFDASGRRWNIDSPANSPPIATPYRPPARPVVVPRLHAVGPARARAAGRRRRGSPGDPPARAPGSAHASTTSAKAVSTRTS